MSGSAGLASARRRRAGPTANVPTKENVIIEQKMDSPSMSPTNPLAVLLKHNELIKVLTQEVAQLKVQVESLKVKPDPSNKENIEYFKQQYSSLLEEMKETKRTLLKIQTFSMETNIEVMKLKKTPVETHIEVAAVEENKIE
jgi:hypothetical protein